MQMLSYVPIECHTCKRSAGRQPRHGLLNDVVWRALQSAQIPSTNEPTSLYRTDRKRQDGASMLPWARGHCVAWDVTVPDTLAPSHVQATAVAAGLAVMKAETAKIAK